MEDRVSRILFIVDRWVSPDTDPFNHPFSIQAGIQAFGGKYVAIVATSKDIDIKLLGTYADERILVVEATNKRDNKKYRVIGVYLSPNHTSYLQWQELEQLKITDNTIVAGDFNAWTDPIWDTFPTSKKKHRRGNRMLAFMATHGLTFTLDDKVEGPGTLTQWEYDEQGNMTKGSRLDFVLVAGAMADVTSRSRVQVSRISDHLLVEEIIKKDKLEKIEEINKNNMTLKEKKDELNKIQKEIKEIQ
ncbi:hypothetical protein DSO57_1024027 [Entomophthora muscae]|uniref:Uncharacterized protein n=1 Tax=Entomophthora muscae TaxID=34485 RepID=A0ACC2TDU0_9FUNG|nr:hypothetical protein DSO57_1024027 [Entomophthora muscae]